jgi:hypothetical protein
VDTATITSVDQVVESPQQEAPAPIERKRSFFSRNVPEEKLNARKYFDIEERFVLVLIICFDSIAYTQMFCRGEVLAGPDRAEVWGEELTEIGKWQRTKGPIYVQVQQLSFIVSVSFSFFFLRNRWIVHSQG